MPRTRLQFKQMKDERMLSILEAALPLFSIYGTKISVDLIATKAKCSHGIVYHYFKNTDEIYEKLILSSTYQSINDSLLNHETGSSYEKIEDIVKILLSFSPDDIEKVSFYNIILKNTGKSSLFSHLSLLIKEAQLSNYVIAGDPDKITNCIFLIFKGIYLQILIEKHPIIKMPSLENIMQLIRKPTTF